jgi:hypothetical protein
VFTVRRLSAERKCLCGANRFKDGPTGLSDELHKQRDSTRTLHTDDNCVTVEGMIREDRREEKM